ncbi:hypothetical protein R3W88_024136 [Solanum pinnatisectum]|uniref:Uncharacterized protein n=1 Tax=Solanum pinnatisectum TaxID=50273 RepID=A0AAV9M0D3_9SOLN|nr:hypothetical protein R3W88_024136 [Solanum pinnatisectum]
MNEDIQPSFSEVGCQSLDLVEHTMVHMFDHTLETRLHLDFVQDDLWVPEEISMLDKGKRKMIKSAPPKIIKNYSTHGAQKRFLTYAMDTNKT